MQKFCLNDSWKFEACDEQTAYYGPCEGASCVDLPFDALTTAMRDYFVPFGFENSYYPSSVFCFYKTVSGLDIKNAEKVYLQLCGVKGECSVFIDGEFIKKIKDEAVSLIDITSKYKSDFVLALRIASHPDGGGYIGCGIASGVSLLVASRKVFVTPSGVSVTTEAGQEKTIIYAFCEVVNNSDKSETVQLNLEVLKQSGKRASQKNRVVKIPANSVKTVEISLKLKNAYLWSLSDPYLYTAIIKLDEIEEERVRFGVKSAAIKGTALFVNNFVQKLKGVSICQDNGMLGCASLLEAEKRKLLAIKEMGFNAVRVLGVPSCSLLDALDLVGLYCVVDIFETLLQNYRSYDNSLQDCYIERVIKKIRNHPSVISYVIASKAGEVYNRGEGHSLIKKIKEKIVSLDKQKEVVVAISELEPTLKEAKEHSFSICNKNSKAKNTALARERNLLGTLTAPLIKDEKAVALVSMYPNAMLYKDKAVLILGEQALASAELFYDIDRHNNIIGAFVDYGVDFLGNDAPPKGHMKPLFNQGGLLDITANEKPIATTVSISLGKKSVCKIFVQDPDGDEGDIHPLWYWPRHLGQTIKVVVKTSGDIVALFLDKKPIGRKLATKAQGNSCVFETFYKPGRLEAISFSKGQEHAKDCLQTPSQPRKIKLECKTKTLKICEYAFIEITLFDKNDVPVSYASRELVVEEIDGLEFVSSFNSNPTDSYPSFNKKSFSTHDGKAIILVKAVKAGTATIRITSEGLLQGKISLRIKE